MVISLNATKYKSDFKNFILGLSYKYSDWDIRLSRFTGLDGTNMEINYNTLVCLMELTSQYNMGSGTISSSFSLAVGKLASLEGRNFFY